MADPVRNDQSAASPTPGRDTRIEELLLAGLDHYFSGQHERAISIWTRVLFLDRNHARARAYIERARSALAEGLREGEEILQTGVAAFQRGDADDARRLLTSAVDRGVSPDEARALLERLDRLTPVNDAAPAPERRRREQPPTAVRPAREGRRYRFATLVFVLGVGLASGALVMMYVSAAGLPWGVGAAVAGASIAPADEPLPVPAPGEASLAHARALYGKGRLREALAELERVRLGDPSRAEADALTATIQRQLLANVGAPR